MSTAGLPTIWQLVAEGAATLPEPFSRAALINWVSARRPDVGVASIATHIQLATDNAGGPPSTGRTRCCTASTGASTCATADRTSPSRRPSRSPAVACC